MIISVPPAEIALDELLKIPAFKKDLEAAKKEIEQLKLK